MSKYSFGSACNGMYVCKCVCICTQSDIQIYIYTCCIEICNFVYTIVSGIVRPFLLW